MNSHFNEILSKFKTFGRKHDLSRVFNDFLTMGICSYHRTNFNSGLRVKDKQNEETYLSVSKRYERDELNLMAQILGHVQINAIDYSYTDILGEFFMQEISRGHNGQYFTPEPICEFMAKISGSDDKIEDQRVMDPACGSGRMLLAFAKSNPNNCFFAADSSDTCAKMTTLNFFVNDLKGEVACMNSLSMEFYAGWHVNTLGIGIVPIEEEASLIWSKAPIAEAVEQSVSGGEPIRNIQQLTLF